MKKSNSLQSRTLINLSNTENNLNTVDQNYDYNENDKEIIYLNKTKRNNNSYSKDNYAIDTINDFEIQINEENQSLIDNDNTGNNENELKIKKRIHYIDGLRVLANIMVVTVHSSSYAIYENPVLSKNWMGLMFWDAMNRACVPIFIMISGVLFLEPQKYISTSIIYKKYIYRLVKIILFWNFFYATFGKYLFGKNEFSWEDLGNNFLKDVISGKFHMWYLYMCVGFYILTPVFRFIARNYDTLKYLIIISIIFSQGIPFIISIFNNYYPNDYIVSIDDVMNKLLGYVNSGYMTYYPMGYYLSKIEIRNKIQLIFIYILGIFTLISTYWLKISSSKKIGKETYDFSDYNSLNVLITSVCIFIFFRFTGSKLLNKAFQVKWFKKLLTLLSDLSFGVYLIHICYFELFFYYGFHSYSFNPLYFTPIHAFSIWICSIITIYLMKKIPVLKNFA